MAHRRTSYTLAELEELAAGLRRLLDAIERERLRLTRVQSPGLKVTGGPSRPSPMVGIPRRDYTYTEDWVIGDDEPLRPHCIVVEEGCVVGASVTSSGTSVELGIAEAEDAAVSGHKAVAKSRGSAHHSHDRLVQGRVPGGSDERCVESKDATVGSHLPIAAGQLV